MNLGSSPSLLFKAARSFSVPCSVPPARLARPTAAALSVSRPTTLVQPTVCRRPSACARRAFASTSRVSEETGGVSPAAWTSTTNYFEILDLPADGAFDIDEGALRRNFLIKSRLVHPDGFKGTSEEEYQAAQQQSAFLNTAYEALKSPFSRAQYLLSLQDIHVNETDAVSNQELLIDIMDAREAIDDAQSEEEVEALRDENRERARAAIKGLSDSFKSGDLERARDLTIELRYWLNVDTAGKDKIHPNE